jgi:hypothetical protein
MKAMDRVLMWVKNNIEPSAWYSDTFGCGEADAEQLVSTPSP